MKFKSPTEKPVYVASTTSVCAWVGPEYRELPACLHREALAKGCITDNMDAASISEQGQSEPGRINAPEERLRDVLVELSVRGGAEDFTRDGLPDMRKLTKKCGFGVNREDMVRIWQQIRATQANKVA